MPFLNSSADDEHGRERSLPCIYPESMQVQESAVSWRVIGAGSTAAAALALILMMLGTGLGLSSVWLFISLLIGAFVSSFAATYGGRQRDL